MEKRIYSKDIPAVMRHRGKISVPVDIRDEPAMAGDPDATDNPTDPSGYSCERVQLIDTGQDLTCPAVTLQLRQEAEHSLLSQTYSSQLLTGCMIESLGFAVDCKPENCADFAQTLVVLGMAYADQPNAAVIVRDYNNINHTITYAEYQVLCQELGAHVMTLRQAKWVAVDNLATMEA